MRCYVSGEAGAELFTLSELHTKMVELAGESEVYSSKRLKQKLKEQYEGYAFFAEIEGRSNVLCFKNMVEYIINEKWYSERKASTKDDAERIVIAAAKIISAEIRETEYNSDSYPTDDDISSNERSRKCIPHHLRAFLKTIVSSELKQTSIGHVIIQASRKAVITPTLFGLGVEMDHVFGSRWLIDELSRLGFSITYDEVNRYKQSVIASESLDSILTEYLPGTFTQWVADNIDHNVATLDGQGTFHGMGIIAVSSPKSGTTLTTNSRVIKRQKRMKVNELVNDRGIPIIQYISPLKRGLSAVTFKPICELQVPYTLPSELSCNLLWHAGWAFGDETKPRPNWSGFMQHVFSDGDHSHSKGKVLFLPIIDLNPSDETCIYSTLLYIQRQAEKLDISTPCLTFDQPLWLKAVEIIKAKAMNIVCRLGGFHTLMSFMGSIGSMMKGSGIEEALETVYSSNVVTHIISGKAVSRALRGHILIEAALVAKLMQSVLPPDNSDSEGSAEFGLDHDIQLYSDAGARMDSDVDIEGGVELNETEASTELVFDHSYQENATIGTQMEIDMGLEHKVDAAVAEKIQALYEEVLNKSMPVSTATNSKELAKLENTLDMYKSMLAERSPTAKLWLQYIEYMEILKLFIWSERTANWNLHLVAVGKMLNLFAATGHVNYAKSARLYLQQMRELPTDHPSVYQYFEQGHHAVRRSSRYWAGLWTDLVIEQVMMRSIKSRGGLTRGRGMTESVRLQWVSSLHKCAGIHDAMTTATNLKHKTSMQHIELGISRCKRDFEDLCKIKVWFSQHEPFSMNEGRLRSLSSGLTATDDDGINCHRTEEVGAEIQQQLDNVAVTEATIKRSKQIKSLDHLYPGVQINKKKIHIDPNILFFRLIAIVQREEDMRPFFDYELTTIPTSLFKDNIMRKTNKAQLATALKQGVQPCEHHVRGFHVLDGGSLLHRVKWGKKATYKDIVLQYVHYVQGKYGHACIIFDGYNQGPSIKDHEHQRRIAKMCADIKLSESTEACVNQQTFLANEHNKAQFISLLCYYLKENSQVVGQSAGDADGMIVERAIQLAREGNVVTVVADDTDILVLLLYHWKETMADIYFQSEVKKSQRKNVNVWKIRDLAAKAGEVIVSNILFIHAWSGCDTTCATFGHGKTALMKKVQDSKELQHLSRMMCDPLITAEQVGKAGTRIFIIMYGGKKPDSLNCLRHAKFMEMATTSKSALDPQKLPPTERAGYYHSLRVHLQIMLWRDLIGNDLDPQQWGWKLEGNKLVPLMTDLTPAPENLLKFVRCKCKLTSRNPCGTNTCSCRKNGLKCVSACGDCRGEGCYNAEDASFEENDVLDD